MSTRLDGEIAVVTGVSKGIGRAIAEVLADAGARVAATHHDAGVCARVAAELGDGHAGIALDVTRRDSIEAAAQEVAATLGEPTVLVNNAGINRIAPADVLGDEDWQAVLDVNLTGLFTACQVFGARMLHAGRGSIVNIGSISGAEVGMPGRAPYAASKAAVVGLTRVLAIEWASRGVRVNVIEPGAVRTPMLVRAIADGIVDERALLERIPAGRLAEPMDVARAALFLASPDSSFVTGQTLVVDGGYTAYGAAGPVTPSALDDRLRGSA
jgi:NAD(P)-dependent dehydrogenase (short-subunit alcohol dehydrogenase family)